MTKLYFYSNQRSYEINNWLPHFSISLCPVTGTLLLCFSALLMRKDSATRRDSSIRSYLHYVLILYLTWVFPFDTGCIVESKATVRATHERTVISYLGGFLSAVVPGGFTECMYSSKEVISLLTPTHKLSGHSFPYTTYLCWLSLCIIGLKWETYNLFLASIIPTCPQSLHFQSPLLFKQQSSGPSNTKLFKPIAWLQEHVRCLVSVWAEESKTYYFNDEGGTLNINLLLFALRFGGSEDKRREEMKGLRGSGWKSSGKNSSDEMGCTLAPVGAWGKGKGIRVKCGICKDQSASKGARGKERRM